MLPPLMQLKLLLPFGVFADKPDVSRIVADTLAGSLGLLPHRLDCVAVLVPGILVYETQTDGEVYVAVDEGVLIKTGATVLVSARQAFAGADLAQLHSAVQHEFLALDAQESNVRTVMAKLEAGFLHRLGSFQHG